MLSTLLYIFCLLFHAPLPYHEVLILSFLKLLFLYHGYIINQQKGIMRVVLKTTFCPCYFQHTHYVYNKCGVVLYNNEIK